MVAVSSRRTCTRTPGCASMPTGSTPSTPTSPRSTSPSTARSPASTRPRPARHPAHRRRGERRRVRGPRRADEPPLDARQLPREAGLTLTGNFANPGGQYIPRRWSARQGVLDRARPERAPRARSPVRGSRWAIPCNVMPRRSSPITRRATGRSSSSQATPPTPWPTAPEREALDALDFVVVIDVFMTETARHSDYVLRRDDAVREVRVDVLQLRVSEERLPSPPRFSKRRGPLDDPRSTPDPRGRRARHGCDIEPLRAPPNRDGRVRRCVRRSRRGEAALGPVSTRAALPHARTDPAPWCGVGRSAVGDRPSLCPAEPERCRRAGFGTGPDAGDRLFDAIVDSPSGVVITEDDHDASGDG